MGCRTVTRGFLDPRISHLEGNVNDKEHQNFRRAMRRGLQEEPDTALREVLGIVALLTWAGAALYFLGVI